MGPPRPAGAALRHHWGTMRAILLAAAVLVAVVVVVVSFGVDEGEVVTLTTRDASGARFDTQLWIVEIDGAAWLRAGRPKAQWLGRLRANPKVEVKRGEEAALYTAVPVDEPAARERVNAAMAAKYGRADGLIDRVFDRGRSVPVRLDPREPDPGEPAPGTPRGPHS